MVNASKILTVSYGTFSCTLEGFDEPFSTMRSIAEYFRDLAADDRYFGAEPPTPDAEMLHRIAEREVNRRVEAHVNKNGVVLRQVERDPEPTGGPVDEAKPSKTAAKGLSGMAVRHAGAAGAANPQNAAADVDAGAMNAAASESVAEKLRRIRAAVARSHVEPQFTGAFAEDEDATEMFRVATIDSAFATDEPEATEIETDAESPAETASSEPAAEESELATEAEPEEQDTVETSESEFEDLLEDAPVESADEAAEAEPENAEDDAEAVVAGEADAEVAEAEEAEDAIEAEAVDEAVEVADHVEDETAQTPVADTSDADIADQIAALSAEADQSESSEAEAEAEVEAEAEAEAEEVAEADTALETEAADDQPADVADFDEATDDSGSDDLDLESLTAKLADTEAEDAPQDAELVPDSAPEDVDTQESAAPVVRARVIKMRRSEFMARYVEATDEDEPESAEADTAAESTDVTPEKIRASLGSTGLSPEDEDDLVSELFAAERDANGQSGTPEADALDGQNEAVAEAPATETLILGQAEEVVDTPPAPAETDTSAETDAKAAPTLEEISASLRAAVEPVTKNSEGLSVTRLLRQADTELQNTDGSRRRSAIAHLKAAVAAVRADGGRARDTAAAEDARAMDEFRNDLARAVRPETAAGKDKADAKTEPAAPHKAETVTPTPVVSRNLLATSEAPRPRRKMPPLMLVSEQRIDKPAVSDADAANVRPRRVHADDDDAVTDQTDTALQSDADKEADDENIFAAADDFSGFVADTDAEGVQELLEASAAFGTLVEGQPFNSRPQIMQRMLRHVPEGTVTREEGLRAFGVLLREGRLVRIQRGQFAVSETSRFRDEPTSKAARG